MDIRILEKPENVSFEQIKELIENVHEDHRKKTGNVFESTAISAEELQNHLGEDGKCFVAMDGDRIVGTISAHPEKVKTFYHKGIGARYRYLVVLPDCQGRGIAGKLMTAADDWSLSRGYKIARLTTREDNTNAIALYERRGFHLCRCYRVGDHYAVMMVKNLKPKPFVSIGYKLSFARDKRHRAK